LNFLAGRTTTVTVGVVAGTQLSSAIHPPPMGHWPPNRPGVRSARTHGVEVGVEIPAAPEALDHRFLLGAANAGRARPKEGTC
jgi:hypothetical protein